ncbi:MAG: PP2C family protein-serine/threonine phosphatase [Planctomycetota bacterium]|nr:PP2C family protein-serine/threonine phosphatase [Planctomycetota bacterium]
MTNGNDSKQVADLMRLIDVSRQLGATVELEPLLKSIEEAALQVLDCERVSVFLYDPNTRELFSKVATGVEDIRFPANTGIAGEAAQTRKTIHVPDAYSDPRFNPEVDKATGFKTRNMLTLSMVGYDGHLVGVLQLLNKRLDCFTTDDERLAEMLSALAGVAIQRQFLMQEYAEKQKLERDLDLAREIQRGYLPQENPRVPGFEIAGWNKPADQTGGDAFDFIPTDDGRLGLLIADATGHGVGPALMVAECRALLRGLASITVDLTQIMAKANEVLVEDLQEGRFVTVCLAFLNSETSTISHLSAGHAPLIHYVAADDHFVELPAATLPLGITENLPTGLAPDIVLDPGDLFILITDGFFEWIRAGGEQFGMKRLYDVIRSNRQSPCSEIIERLHRAVVEFGQGAPQEDDLTAIIVKRL